MDLSSFIILEHCYGGSYDNYNYILDLIAHQFCPKHLYPWQMVKQMNKLWQQCTTNGWCYESGGQIHLTLFHKPGKDKIRFKWNIFQLAVTIRYWIWMDFFHLRFMERRMFRVTLFVTNSSTLISQYILQSIFLLPGTKILVLMVLYEMMYLLTYYTLTIIRDSIDFPTQQQSMSKIRKQMMLMLHKCFKYTKELALIESIDIIDNNSCDKLIPMRQDYDVIVKSNDAMKIKCQWASTQIDNIKKSNFGLRNKPIYYTMFIWFGQNTISRTSFDKRQRRCLRYLTQRCYYSGMRRKCNFCKNSMKPECLWLASHLKVGAKLWFCCISCKQRFLSLNAN